MPNGWTTVAGGPYTYSYVGTVSSILGWKLATSSAEPNVTFGATASGAETFARIAVFRGVNQDHPVFDENVASPTAVSFGGVWSTGDAGDMWVGFASNSVDSTAGQWSPCTSTGLLDIVERYDNGTTSGAGANFMCNTGRPRNRQALGDVTPANKPSSMGAADAQWSVMLTALDSPGLSVKEIASGNMSTSTNTTSIQFTATAGEMVVVLAWQYAATARSMTPGSGLTQIGSTVGGTWKYSSNTFYSRHAMYHITATGEPQTVTIATSGAITSGFYSVIQLSGLKNAEVADFDTIQGSGGSIPYPVMDAGKAAISQG